jgi:hypothetical protein
MISTRLQNWFRRPTGSGDGVSRPRHNEVRPRLESLESREAPAGLVATSTAITAITQQYTLFNQKETITAAVTSTGTTVNQGLVTLFDGGLTQIVNVTNGTTTATFTFPLFAEIPKAHVVNANYADNTAGVLTNLASSSAQATASDTTTGYIFQLYFDYYLFVSLTGALPHG